MKLKEISELIVEVVPKWDYVKWVVCLCLNGIGLGFIIGYFIFK